MDEVLDQIKKLILQYESPEKIILFGSRARTDQNERSDYDIAVISRADDINVRRKIREAIAEHVRTLLSIDVVWNTEISADFKKEIMKHGIVIYDAKKN